MKPLVGPLLPAGSSVKTWVKLHLLGSLPSSFPWTPRYCAILARTATQRSEVQDTSVPPRVSFMSVLQNDWCKGEMLLKSCQPTPTPPQGMCVSVCLYGAAHGVPKSQTGLSTRTEEYDGAHTLGFAWGVKGPMAVTSLGSPRPAKIDKGPVSTSRLKTV